MKCDTRAPPTPPPCNPPQPACFTNYTIYFGHLRGLNCCGSISLPWAPLPSPAPPLPWYATSLITTCLGYITCLQLRAPSTVNTGQQVVGWRDDGKFLCFVVHWLHRWYRCCSISSACGFITISIKVTLKVGSIFGWHPKGLHVRVFPNWYASQYSTKNFKKNFSGRLSREYQEILQKYRKTRKTDKITTKYCEVPKNT